MTKVKTAISIDNELLAETVSLARELDIPRSQVVSLALEGFIQRYRNRQLLLQINRAYSDAPDAEDMEAMKIAHSHRQKLGDHDEWK